MGALAQLEMAGMHTRPFTQGPESPLWNVRQRTALPVQAVRLTSQLHGTQAFHSSRDSGSPPPLH